jgi:hypothetical protein
VGLLAVWTLVAGLSTTVEVREKEKRKKSGLLRRQKLSTGWLVIHRFIHNLIHRLSYPQAELSTGSPLIHTPVDRRIVELSTGTEANKKLSTGHGESPHTYMRRKKK